MSDGNADVEVAVVNWNTAVAAHASALAFRDSRGVRARVTIIDNRSSPEQRELLTSETPAGVTVRLADTNLGYGAAANAVLSPSDAPVVCVSNADLVPEASMLATLAAIVRDDDSVGLAAPVLDGVYHVRLPPAWALPLKPFLARAGVRAEPFPEPGQVLEVEQPAGACLVARSGTWRRLGGFDDSFFLWFEDVDLARRSLQGGWRNVVAGDARAVHQQAAAFEQVDPRARQHLRLASLERYAAKHHPELTPAMRLTLALARRLRVGSRGAEAARQLTSAGDARRAG